MALLAASLTGCTGIPSPYEYDLVDAAAEQLGVTHAGVTLIEQHRGQMKRLSGEGPTVEFRIATEDSTAAARTIVDRAKRIGWDGQLDQNQFLRGFATISTDGYFLQLYVTSWTANGPVPGAEDKTRTSNRSGIDVLITQS
ncbi:hypothetical protein [Leifsonia sp. NPDC077715]|uniref:hypothetical protein n=1 Tax=Leifsonia sp. NPDC077715 TaxID=3155539 RepID=UPI003422CC60